MRVVCLLNEVEVRDLSARCTVIISWELELTSRTWRGRICMERHTNRSNVFYRFIMVRLSRELSVKRQKKIVWLFSSIKRMAFSRDDAPTWAGGACHRKYRDCHPLLLIHDTGRKHVESGVVLGLFVIALELEIAHARVKHVNLLDFEGCREPPSPWDVWAHTLALCIGRSPLGCVLAGCIPSTSRKPSSCSCCVLAGVVSLEENAVRYFLAAALLMDELKFKVSSLLELRV